MDSPAQLNVPVFKLTHCFPLASFEIIRKPCDIVIHHEPGCMYERLLGCTLRRLMDGLLLLVLLKAQSHGQVFPPAIMPKSRHRRPPLLSLSLDSKGRPSGREGGSEGAVINFTSHYCTSIVNSI